MNVLHISTYDHGGAAIAAKRLHSGLMQKGVKSKMLCLRKRGGQYKEVFHFQDNNIIRPILRKLGVHKCHYKNNRKIRSSIKGIYENLTFPETDFRVHKHPLVKQADIINLHWVGDFLDYRSFFKSINKPVVWTLHDMNPFSGLVHYFGDYTRNKVDIELYENQFLEKKVNALAKFKLLHAVAPSRWLHDQARNSLLLSKFSHSRIPYGLNLSLFNKKNKEECKKKFSLPLEKKIVLFVASNIHNPRKGFDLLLECKKKLSRENIIFVTVGANNGKPEEDIIYLGNFNEEEMSYVYASADLFIIPSREDNLPNTMLEAIACGTPVVGFNIGGIPDAVVDNMTGLLAKPEDADDLSFKVRCLLDADDLRENMSSNARNHAVENFSLELQSERYISLYESFYN